MIVPILLFYYICLLAECPIDSRNYFFVEALSPSPMFMGCWLCLQARHGMPLAKLRGLSLHKSPDLTCLQMRGYHGECCPSCVSNSPSHHAHWAAHPSLPPAGGCRAGGGPCGQTIKIQKNIDPMETIKSHIHTISLSQSYTLRILYSSNLTFFQSQLRGCSQMTLQHWATYSNSSRAKLL